MISSTDTCRLRTSAVRYRAPRSQRLVASAALLDGLDAQDGPVLRMVGQHVEQAVGALAHVADALAQVGTSSDSRRSSSIFSLNRMRSRWPVPGISPVRSAADEDVALPLRQACRRCRTPCPRRRSTASSTRSAARSPRCENSSDCHGPGIGAAVADDRPAVVRARLQDVDLVAAVRAVLVLPDLAGARVHGQAERAAMAEREDLGPRSRPCRRTGCRAARCRRPSAAAPCPARLFGSCATVAAAAAGRDVERAVAAERHARGAVHAGAGRRRCPSCRSAPMPFQRPRATASVVCVGVRGAAWRRTGRRSCSSANCGWSTTSISPFRPAAATAGTPATGCGSRTPLRMTRSRPGRSVTSMSPSGRNARLHGLRGRAPRRRGSAGPRPCRRRPARRAAARRDARRGHRDVAAERHLLLRVPDRRADPRRR